MDADTILMAIMEHPHQAEAILAYLEAHPEELEALQTEGQGTTEPEPPTDEGDEFSMDAEEGD